MVRKVSRVYKILLIFVILLFYGMKGDCANMTSWIVEPASGFYIAAVGSDYKALCQSKLLPTWSRRGNYSSPFIGSSYSYYLVNSDVMKVLPLKDITYRAVGFYDCLPPEEQDQASRNSSFYLYVDDPEHLFFGPRVTRVVSRKWQPAVVPCRPTAPDVTVKLLTSTRDPTLLRQLNPDELTFFNVGALFEPSLSPPWVKFSTNPADEDELVYFDPRRGFIMPSAQMVAAWFIYICEFSKRGVQQDMEIDLFVATGINNNYLYLEYQANAKWEFVVKPGETVTFVAEVFTNYRPKIIWQDVNGAEINTGRKFRVEESPGEPWETRLVISNVQQNDTGVYKVQSTRLNSLSFKLYVGAPDYLTMEIPKVTKRNEPVMALCLLKSGGPHGAATWSFRPNGCHPGDACETVIPEIEEFDIGSHVKEDLISATVLYPRELGNLTCSVSLVFGVLEVTKPVILSMADDGFEIMTPHQIVVSHVLSCVVSKYLYTDHLYWIGPDGFVIEGNVTTDTFNLTQIKSEDYESYTLELSVEYYGAAPDGNYRCMAVDFNHVPAFRSHYVLFAVFHGLGITSNMINDTLFVENLSTLTLNCTGIGFPRPVLEWFKDGINLRHNNSILTKKSITFEDQGEYSCKVSNEVGSEMAFTNVKVYIKPEIEETNLSGLEGEVSGKCTLYCHAKGNAYVSWSKDGKDILDSPRRSLSSDGSVLEIYPLQFDDAGTYNCVSGNEGPVSYAESGYLFIRENSPNYEIGTVTGSIFGVMLLIGAAFMVFRIYQLRVSRTPLSYRNLLLLSDVDD